MRVRCAGVSLLEVLIVVAIVAILIGISSNVYVAALDESMITRATAELRAIEKALADWEAETGSLPGSLTDVGWGAVHDPWGNPYRYQVLADVPQGEARKDRFLVPLNSDYDLYSMGEDGDSKGPLTAKASRDDIVRAGDGAFIGLASEF